MKRVVGCWLLVVLPLCACDAPSVYPTKDRRQNTSTSHIEGNIVVTSKARGNAVVFLFDAARPPPPQGTGRPLTFTVVSESAIFGDALTAEGSSGPFTAPYAFSLVPPGRYRMRGFIDHDECVGSAPGCIGPDFIPWYGVTAEANKGDVGGAAVDAVTREDKVIEIAPFPDGSLNVPTGVQVSFADSATLPADRPAFKVTSGTPQLDLKTLNLFELTVNPIDSGVVHQRAPVFFVRWVDDNLDGVPDDANKDGKPEVWPKIFVRKLATADNPLLDENDLDKNGIIDATGPDYEHVNPLNGQTIPADGKPDAVILSAGIDYTALAMPGALLDATGKPNMAAVIPQTKVRLVVKAPALDVSDPTAPGVLAAVPSGVYAIIVLNFTGQSWRLPNELIPPVAAKTGLPADESQAFLLVVP
jgi:hypothetical protein